MKITALKQQVKNPGRVSIFVNEKYSFSLTINQVADYGVKKDLEISEAELKNFKKMSEDGKLAARALEWVLNRPHSVREFKDYMYRKKAEPELAGKLIEEFGAKGYLNDEAYGRWLIELRARTGKSNRAMSAELFAKGLDREVIGQILEEQEASEAERLRVLVAKKRPLSRYKNDDPKLIKYLTSQGFSYDLVRQELNT